MVTRENRCSVPGRRWRRSGLTLVELMASITVSLIMILAMVQFFKVIGDKVAIGRASVELSTRLRATTNRIQDDLDTVTLPGLPWPKQGSGLGYFEIGEGVVHDGQYLFVANSAYSIYGDHDDYVAMTIRAKDRPFVGRVRSEILGQPAGGYVTIESKLAEVIWWIHLEDKNGNGAFDIAEGELFTLRRRIFLIRPDLNNAAGVVPNVGATSEAQLLAIRNDNDLSVAFDPMTNRVSANSLVSLTRRSNRVAHLSGDFRPNPMGGPPLANFPNPVNPNFFPRQVGPFQGEDVMLASCLSFDLRVFDPNVPVRYDAVNDQALVPTDPGYPAFVPNPVGLGAFVDLGINVTLGLGLNTDFTGGPAVKSQLGQFVYDTWSFDYEHDLIDQNGNGQVDEGTDGINSGGVAATVDEVEERETSPPYPVPLRGVQIRIRTMDRSTRQVRQATVQRDLAPD